MPDLAWDMPWQIPRWIQHILSNKLLWEVYSTGYARSSVGYAVGDPTLDPAYPVE